MDNEALSVLYLNEFNLVENVRNQPGTNALYEGENTETISQQESDRVEFSAESLQLSQKVDNLQDFGINPIQEETLLEEPFPPEPLITEDENFTQQLDNTISAFENTIETEPYETTSATSVSTIIGTVNTESVETENLSEEIPTETEGAVEDQANQLSRINEILNNGYSTNSQVGEVERAVEPAQYQQQILLQTIGTQLAQVAPPSNIISFLV